MRPLNVKGKRYGMLVAEEAVVCDTKHGRLKKWWCRCDCGAYVVVGANTLAAGSKKSCGCATKKMLSDGSTKHGHFKGKQRPPEWGSWSGMIARCHNPKCKQWRWYGAKGVTVCERWRESFGAFMDDMGKRPPGCNSIDRIDNSKGYEPGNCRWANPTDQARNTANNRNVTINGQTKCLAAWIEVSDLCPSSVFRRLAKGWSEAEALLTPARQQRYSTVTVIDIDLSPEAVAAARAKLGWSPQ